MCKRRKSPKGLRKNLGYFATLSFIRLPIVAGISQCSEHAHVHTHTYTQERILLPNTLGKCCRTYQASGWPVAEACSLDLTCHFPAYLILGCTLESAAVESIWISHWISHQALVPACGSHQPPWNPLFHCPCILGMSSWVSFPTI